MKKTILLKFNIMKYFYAAGIIISFISCNAPSGITRIWAVDDGEKIKKEDLENPLANDLNNTVWNNNTVNIFGAKNEIIAFQLIIQANSSGVDQINVEISDLANGNSVIPGSTTGSSDPFDFRGRNIELFTEHYLNMVKRSPPLWFFSDSAVPSAYYTGWVPDCLIPFSAPSGKGGAPFSIDANINQGIWVDILIPENAIAGTYTGNVTVTIADKVFQTIPVSLKVYDFALSDSTHLKNMFGYSPRTIARRHNVSGGTKEYYDLQEERRLLG